MDWGPCREGRVAWKASGVVGLACGLEFVRSIGGGMAGMVLVLEGIDIEHLEISQRNLVFSKSITRLPVS